MPDSSLGPPDSVVGSIAGDTVADRPGIADVLRALTPTEQLLMARVLFDREPQILIAADLNIAQTTVSKSVRKAVGKLHKAGFTGVKPPGRGRRPRQDKERRVDPADMDRLVTTKRDPGSGPTIAKWIGSSKIDKA